MRKCPQCGKKKEFLNSLCGVCVDCMVENLESQEKMESLEKDGHSSHCANRQVYGDGECECDLYGKGYDPYAWLEEVPSDGI